MQNRGNICVLSHGEIANDSRVLKTIKYFNQKGYSVWVYYPGDKNKIPYGSEFEQTYFYPVKRKQGWFYRFLAHTLIAYEYNYLANNAITTRIDFNYIYVNDLPSLCSGIKIKKSNPGSKLVYDSHEIFVETLNQSFPGSYSFLKRFIFLILLRIMKQSARLFEKKALKYVDYFITVNESLKDYFEKYNGFKDIRIMMNCPELETSHVSKPIIVDYRQEFGWGRDSTIFIYQGVLTQGRGLQLLVESIIDTSSLYKLIIIGSGALETVLKDFCTKKQLNKQIKFLGFIANDQLKYYTKAADVGVNLLEPFNLSKAMASPNKLFEYIHAGIPVIVTNTFENRKVLAEFDVGVLVENNIGDLHKAFNYFSNKKNRMEKVICHKHAQYKYCWENQVKAMNDIITA